MQYNIHKVEDIIAPLFAFLFKFFPLRDSRKKKNKQAKEQRKDLTKYKNKKVENRATEEVPFLHPKKEKRKKEVPF